ncbi:MAG: T9SS type A sorting domain-containing protein, partial [Calditrichaeota bacterium]|nr:T9SS type A sorting domain-containing protein [Calditrichota bacterium]
PAWLTFDGTVLSGHPLSSDTGVIFINISADDLSEGIKADTFSIVVNDIPKLLNLIPNQIIYTGTTFNFTFGSNTFWDNNELFYDARLITDENLPNWLNFNSTNRTFQGTPGSQDIDTLLIKIIADDNKGGIATTEFSLEVKPLPIEYNIVISQNPILMDYVTVFLQSNLTITNFTTASVSFNGINENLLFIQTDGDSLLYHSAYKLKGNGVYSLDISAKAKNSTELTLHKEYSAVSFEKNGSQNNQLINNELTLTIPPASFKINSYIFSTKNEHDIYSIKIPAESKNDLKLDIRLPESTSNPGKYFIYQKNNRNWKSLVTQIYEKNGIYIATTYIKSGGDFKIEYDVDFSGSNLVPKTFALLGNYPNPFNPTTTIRYNLAENTHVQINIYNVLGQKVRSLLNRFQLAGSKYDIIWDGLDDAGKSVSSGVYFYQLVTPQFRETKRMLLVK